MLSERRILQHRNMQGYPLRDHIALHHPLVELADMIEWAATDRGYLKINTLEPAGRFSPARAVLGPSQAFRGA